MKLMRYAVIAALLGSSFLSTAQAALFDFSFTFSNQALGGGTITGIVRGLTDNSTSSASSVEITGNSSGFGLGEYIGNPSFNSWTMSSGMITGHSFSAAGSDNSAPEVTCCTLFLNSSFSLHVLSNSPDTLEFLPGPASISFARLVTTVPEPDVSWLLGAAVVGIGASVRKYRRTGVRVSRT